RSIILLAGVPATGKSTFGQHLADKHGFAHYDLTSQWEREPLLNSAAPHPAARASARRSPPRSDARPPSPPDRPGRIAARCASARSRRRRHRHRLTTDLRRQISDDGRPRLAVFANGIGPTTADERHTLSSGLWISTASTSSCDVP